MSAESKSGSFSESLLLDDSEQGVVVKGITNSTIAAKSGLQAGDEIVAATIHLDHLNKNEVLNILKVLEPYDNNMRVLTKKDLGASVGLGSLGLDPAEKLELKKDLFVNASADAPSLSLDGLNGDLNTGYGGDLKGPSLNGDLPGFGLNQTSANTTADLSLPSLSGPAVKGDLDGTLKSPDIKLSGPKIDTPEIKTGKHKAPAFSMPHFNLPQIIAPGADVNVSDDVQLPSVNGNLETPGVNLSAPNINVENPNIDLTGQNLDLNGPGLNLNTTQADIEAPSGKMKWFHPKWKGPKVKGPDADLNADLSAPDISLPSANINGNLSAPVVDPSAKINWPHQNWKFPKLHGPKADIDANLNKPDVDLSLPTVKGEINNPDVNIEGLDLNMQNQSVAVDAPSGKIIWPHQKWKMGKLHGPKADVDLNTDLDTPNLDGNINIDAPSGKIPWPHQKWKRAKFHGPKADVDVDADLCAPDVDLSLPKSEIDVKAPEADIDVPSSKVKFPTLKKPKFLFSGPKVNTPDVNLDADVSAPDASLSVPSLDGPDAGLILPETDVGVNATKVDIDAPSGKIKWPTLKKPKWTLSGPKVNGPDIDADADLNLSGPVVNGPDVNLPKADLDGPKIDINGPDVEGPSGKFSWLNFKKPKFGTLKGPKADIDADVKLPDGNLEGPDLKVNAPDYSLPSIDGGINGGIDAPDFDIQGPNTKVDVDAPGKVKIPKLKFPGLNLTGPKVKGPNVDVDGDLGDLNLSAPDVDANITTANLSAPKIEGGIGDLNTPDVNADASGKIKVPTFSMPKFNFGGPKVPDADLPSADVKAQNVELSAPGVDVGANQDFSLPTINAPDVDLNLPKAEVKSPNFSAPNIDLKGRNVQLEAPDANLDSSLGDFKMPHYKLPGLESSGIDANISGPAVDLPVVDAGVKVPNVDVKAPNVDANLEKPKLPHFKLPKLNFSGSGVKTPELASPSVEGRINSPNVSVSTPGVETSLNTPDLDLKADVDAGIKGSPKSKLRWPFKWGSKSGSGSDEEGSGLDPENDVSAEDFGFPAFKFHNLPRNSIDGSGGIDETLGLIKLDTESKDYVVSKGIRLPIVNATSKSGGKVDIMERLKMARDKVPSANVSPTDDIDLKLAAPSVDISGSAEAGDASLVRGGTFKVEKPDSGLGLGLLTPSTSDENDKLSVGLSNMLGLN